MANYYDINESEHLTTDEQVQEFAEFMAREYPENLKVEAHDGEDFEWFVQQFIKTQS